MFLDDAHPSMHSRHRKEGLSLYSLLDSTLTPLGKRLLRSWLLKPSADPGVIQRRHDAISLFTRGENETAIMQLRAGLKMIGNIRKLVRNMQSQPAVADFQAILRFAYYSIKIRTHVREVVGGGRVEIIRKVGCVGLRVFAISLALMPRSLNDIDRTIIRRSHPPRTRHGDQLDRRL